MSMIPRGFNKDGKGSRTSSKYFGEAPLSGRTMNENYYQDPAPKSNYMSRQFTQGIFTNQLNRKAQRKQIQKDLPIQLQQEPELDYKNQKVRSSKKQYEFQKQSRDEYSINHQQTFDYYGFSQKQWEQLKKELSFFRQEIEINLMDVVKKMMNDQTSKVRQSINDLITQTNNGFKKKQQTFYVLKTETYGLKEEVAKLTKSYHNFCQESEQKFENLHVELSNLSGVKRSKVGQYNMDLKNSYAGLNSSLSVNMGNQNPNSKLVNEVIFQLDNMKKELSQNKMQIQQLNFELNAKMLEVRNDSKDKNNVQTDVVSMKFEQITKLVKEMLKQDKKCSKWDQRIDRVEGELFNFDLRIKRQQQFIEGINNEIANLINSQINPKIKKIQSSLVDLFSRIDSSELQKMMKQQINQDLNLRMKDIRTIRIRNCSKQEQTKISVITGLNEDKISYRQTYLLDQDNYLLDSQGNYLVQEVDGRKERIRIQNEHLYLLQLKGIQITSAT